MEEFNAVNIYRTVAEITMTNQNTVEFTGIQIHKTQNCISLLHYNNNNNKVQY
jgi:hypothetical protein